MEEKVKRFNERHSGRRSLYYKLYHGGMSLEEIAKVLPPIGYCPEHGDSYMSCRKEHGINGGGRKKKGE